METLSIILIIIGILAVIEALIGLFFTKDVVRVMKYFGRMKPKTIRKISFIELIIAIVLILIVWLV